MLDPIAVEPTDETLKPTAPLDAVGSAATLSGTDIDTEIHPNRRAPLARGSALGRYVVIDRLGAGGMGVVYRAFDPDLDRSVALKLVGVASPEGSASDEERSRLLREAQAMARLSHPNVISVFDVGILDDAVFVAMELVDGVTLGTWLKDHAHGWEQVLPVFVDAGRGLVAAHEAGLIHRDFKPDNVMVGLDGRVRVLDFGLARSTEASVPSSQGIEDIRSSTRDSLSRSMTVEGTVMGTPAYMAPEQHLGAAAGASADQFAFCVALFEALFGARPFAGETLATLSMSVLSGKVTMPAGARGKAPSWLTAAIMRGLSVDPTARFESMEALLTALTPDTSRRRRAVLIGVGAVAVLGVGAFAGAALTSTPEPPEPASSLCTGAAEAMGEVWSPQRRTTIGDAFARTGLAYATDAWEGPAAIIDGKAEAWIAEHTAACRATRVTGELSTDVLDLRMACLDRQRQRIDALATALTEADAESVGRSFDAARRLPSADRCADLAALQAEAPLPAEPERREQLDALRAELDAVYSQTALGRQTAAREQLTAILPRVEVLDYPALTAEALDLDAELESDTGDINAAVDTAVRAYAAATAAGDSRRAALVAHGLAFMVGNRQANADDGLRWVQLGRASLRHLGGDDQLSARFDSAQGAISVAAGRYDDGIVAHTRAREYWESADPTGPDLAAVLNDIGAALVMQGKPTEAIELHREALRLKELAYGDNHPQVAASARELGAALSQMHKYDEARAQFERVLAINGETRGENNVHTATALDDLGRVLRRQDKLDEAIAHHRRALEIWEAVLGDPHPDLAVSVLNVGYTLNAAERFEDALAEFQRALVMFDASVGPVHPYIVYASNSVASGLVDLDRHAEARPHVERVLAMDVEVDPTLIAETKFIYTHVLWASGSAADKPKARRMAAEALASYETQAERWGPQIEQIKAWLATNG